MTKQVKEQTDLLKEAHTEVSKMVKQLKLRETDEQELAASLRKASREIESLKKSYNFRLNLA